MTDDQPLRDILATYGPALRRVARSYAGAAGEDEDLYQETLYQIWRSLGSYRGESGLGTWVYRIALNTALTYRRKAMARSRTAIPLEAANQVPAPGSAEPDRQLAILEEFLGGLGAVDRSVLLLYLEGLSQREIADVTGASAGAIGVRLHRIKRAFKVRYVER